MKTEESIQKLQRLIDLKSQYRVLSEIEECFSSNSNHKAYVLIQKKMKIILFEMNELKDYMKNI